MAYRSNRPRTAASVSVLPLSPSPVDGSKIIVLGTPEAAYAQTGAWFQGGQQVLPQQNSIFTSFQMPNQTVVTDSGQYTRPFDPPEDATAFYAYVSNTNPIGTVGNSLACNFAAWTSEPANANKVGTLIGAALIGQAVPADGTFVKLGPFPVTRGSDGKVCWVYSIPSTGGNVAWSTGNWHGWSANHQTAVNPPPTPDGQSITSALWTVIQYVTGEQQFECIGDSLLINSTNDVSPVLTGGYEGAAWYQIGVQKKIAVSMQGYGGAKLAEFADPTTYPFRQEFVQGLVNNAMILLGTNDVPDGQPTMTVNLRLCIANFQARGARRIWAMTLAPSTFYAIYDAQRLAYNADLLANFASYGLYGVFDYNAWLEDPSDHSQIYPPYTTDGTHFTPLGNLVVFNNVVAQMGLP